MNSPTALRDQIRLPVIGAPMFLVSGPQLVVAQCAAGIIGTFPSLNARPQEQLHEWITRIDVTTQEDQKLVDSLPARGFVPIYSKESFTPDGESRFDVVYAKPLEVAAWEYRKYNDEEFRRKDRELRDRGYELVCHQGPYRVNGILWHNCIWHKNR